MPPANLRSYGVSSIYRQRSGNNRAEHKDRKGAINGPTVITPKQPNPVPVIKRKDALKESWKNYFPHVDLSDNDYHKLALIPYPADLTAHALGMTSESSAFGSNRQYSARRVIAYTAAIARRLAGNSPMPKQKNRKIPVSSPAQMPCYHVPAFAMETYHKLASTGTQSYTGDLGEDMRALVDKKLVTILGKQGRTYNIRLRSLEEWLTTYARHYVKACKVCNPPAKKLPHNRPQARKLARKHMGRKNVARNRTLRKDASTKGEL